MDNRLIVLIIIVLLVILLLAKGNSIFDPKKNDSSSKPEPTQTPAPVYDPRCPEGYRYNSNTGYCE